MPSPPRVRYFSPTPRRCAQRGWFGIDIVSCFPAGYIAQMAAALSSDPETSNDNIKNLKGAPHGPPILATAWLG